MNTNTELFFKCITENTNESFEKMQKIWTISENSKDLNLAELALDLKATFPIRNIYYCLLSYAIFCDNFEAFEFLIEKRHRY